MDPQCNSVERRKVDNTVRTVVRGNRGRETGKNKKKRKNNLTVMGREMQKDREIKSVSKCKVRILLIRGSCQMNSFPPGHQDNIFILMQHIH